MFQNLLYSTSDSNLTILINRPAVRNALNVETLEELRDALDRARSANSIRCVIISGAGDKAFVAGGQC